MFQLFFCRHIDNFQIFLEELLGDIARTQPSMLAAVKLRKSEESLPDDEKLERRLRKLSFMSFSELTETISAAMSFEILPSQQSTDHVAHLFDLRNLITHRYGVIDAYFAKKYPDNLDRVGTTMSLDPKFVQNAVKRLAETASDIQKRALKKFPLPYRTVKRGEKDWWE